MKSKIQNPKSKKSSLSFELCALHFSRRRGFTLFYAMLISSLLLAIGLAIFNITYKEFILTSGIRESESAFYAADSALECALYWDFVHDGVSTPAFGFYGDSLASGLVGYWRFEEETDFQDKAFDSSGQGNVMDVTPIGTGRSDGGQIGQSLPFDGGTTFANTGGINGLSFGDSKEHTISAWIKIPQYPGKTETEWVLVLGDPGDGDGVHRWTIDSSGVLSMIGGTATLSSSPLPLDETFTHVAVTYDENSTLTLYVGGAEIVSARGDFFTNFSSTPPFTLGEAFASGGSERGNDIRFLGELDDVRVYNRALSAEEVLKMKNEESNNIFVDPVGEASAGIVLSCDGEVINDPATGWVPLLPGADGNWKITSQTAPDIGSQTVFDITFDDGTCALVEVTKTVTDVAGTPVSSTETISRGYNTCDLNNSRRLERAIRATY